MRQGQQNRRGRGRGRKPQNPLSRNLESNGPDVKIRGTAAHIAEKYSTLARDALAAGDTVAGESYLQHAEHYNRIIMAGQSPQGGDGDGSGPARTRHNGSGDGADDKQPEVAVDGNAADPIADDEGVARTVARSAKRSGNGADKANEADATKEAEADEAPDKGGADEAVT